VKFVGSPKVREWQTDRGRTLYLLDVRSREEFEAKRIAGSRHAPGGQLVQATDEYVGVRNSRIVLVDPERVRSVMTASWLNQMGWDDVHVLEPEGTDGFAGWPTESGPRRKAVPGLRPWPATSEVRGATVLDFSTSLRFRARHIPGAWWLVRSRLGQAKEKIGDAKRIVLTSEDGVLAQLAAPEAAALWPGAEVKVLAGGNDAYFAGGKDAESGVERATTTLDDVAYKAYDHVKDYAQRAREYLEWEVALVDQIKRDPAIRFRAY
jgi:rhodanese-related sulfurtransferase